MKNLSFLFIYILLLTGCCLNPTIEENTFSVKANCDSNGYVSPRQLVVNEGDSARIAITPYIGCEVKSVLVNGQNVPVPVNNILVIRNINSDIEVIVSIVQKSIVTEDHYKLSVSSSLGGTISPSGEITLKKGEAKNFSAVANSDYLIDSLVIDGENMEVPAIARQRYDFSFKANDTLDHTIRVVFRKKEIYTITVVKDENAIVTGNTSVIEGSSTTLYFSWTQFFSGVVKVDGEIITGSSYTFTNVSKNHTVEVVSQKNPEWYLVNIKWKQVYLNINGTEYQAIDEVLDFLPDGTCKRYSNGKFDGYTLNWKKSDGIITFQYSGPNTIATIDTCNTETMVFHYNGYTGAKIIQGYSNIGYQEKN